MKLASLDGLHTALHVPVLAVTQDLVGECEAGTHHCKTVSLLDTIHINDGLHSALHVSALAVIPDVVGEREAGTHHCRHVSSLNNIHTAEGVCTQQEGDIASPSVQDHIVEQVAGTHRSEDMSILGGLHTHVNLPVLAVLQDHVDERVAGTLHSKDIDSAQQEGDIAMPSRQDLFGERETGAHHSIDVALLDCEDTRLYDPDPFSALCARSLSMRLTALWSRRGALGIR